MKRITVFGGSRTEPGDHDYQQALYLGELLGKSGYIVLTGGYIGTIKALKTMTKTDGLIVIGEVFWLKEPDKEYLETSGIKKEEFGTHRSKVRIGEEEGLTCIYTLVSDLNDWDHYESLRWSNVYDFVKTNPYDKDIPELLERTSKEKYIFLRWERDTIGWGIYVFRKNKAY